LLKEIEELKEIEGPSAEICGVALCCCMCGGELAREPGRLRCLNEHCRREFPIVNGIPVLINESNSIFSIQTFLDGAATFFRDRPAWKKRLGQVLPELSRNPSAEPNYRKFAAQLLAANSRPVVLVVGGCVTGRGAEEFLSHPGIEFVETDVSFGPRTRLICDAHDLPFPAQSFDGVVAQAVLEHVADPARCVQQMHRVLRPGGLVYAETAFMQQVHGGGYDFTRFTPLGHRRLFREFDELDSGAACGPGMALAWAWQHFLLSFARNRAAAAGLAAFARLSGFWLKYFDAFLLHRPGALDGASAVYFMGRRSEQRIEDRALPRLYRGMALGFALAVYQNFVDSGDLVGRLS
jgi:SAM-dependent methyltransferase